jgi:ABC-2 type transport system permease protein
MNILMQELRFHRTSFLIWGFVLFAVSFLFLASFAAYEIDESFVEIIDTLPDAIKSAFYLDVLNIAEIHGYFAGNTYTYLVILASIYSVMMASGLFSKEIDRRTAEFLYTRPVKRSTIFFEKLLSMLIHITGVHLFILAGIMVTLWAVLDEPYSLTIFIGLIVGLWLASLAVGGIGLLISTLVTSERKGLTIGIAIVLLSYLFHILSGLADVLEGIKYLSFFYYLQPAKIVLTESIPWAEFSLFIAIAVLSILIALILFQKRDIQL